MFVGFVCTDTGWSEAAESGPKFLEESVNWCWGDEWELGQQLVQIQPLGLFFFLSTQSGPKSHPLWLAGARTPIAGPRPAAGTANRLTTKTLLRCELSQPVHHLVRLRFNYAAIVLRCLNLFKPQFVVFNKIAPFLGNIIWLLSWISGGRSVIDWWKSYTISLFFLIWQILTN